jgi:hypothetical protein
MCVLVCAQPHNADRHFARSIRLRSRRVIVIAIVGAILIDGRGGPVVTDSVVVIQGDRIVAVGEQGAVQVRQVPVSLMRKG